MQVKILKEAGHEQALLGMSLSFYDHKLSLEDFWTDAKKERAAARAKKLAHQQGGHNKFIESMQVWIFIQASRDFWSEFDTYRAGVTKQSSSTMHTLSKRLVDMDDFEKGTKPAAALVLNECIRAGDDVTTLKKNLPEGWLQERVVCTNYKVLQHIIGQRKGHRLEQWQEFCREILAQAEHKEYLL